MQGRNHVALALAGALVLATPPDTAAWLGLVVGSLAPDIDGGGHIAYAGSTFLPHLVPRPIRQLIDALGVGISAMVRKLFGHRGALHWPVWGIMLWFLGYNLGLTWLQWFGFGYTAHILGDMLTVSGVPLFGPVSRADVSLLPMRTGSPLETLFGLGLWAFVGWRLLPTLYTIDGGRVLEMVKRFSTLF